MYKIELAPNVQMSKMYKIEPALNVQNAPCKKNANMIYWLRKELIYKVGEMVEK